MNQIVFPSKISGSLIVPPSKSYMQRALALALLSKSKNNSKLYNPSFSEDAKAALEICEILGAKINIKKDHISIFGQLKPETNEINCGESGLSTRMFMPIVSLLSHKIVVTGKGSLLLRPVQFMESTLQKMGVKITTNKGFLPAVICGSIQAGSYSIDGSLSSQFLTGLLIALPLLKEDTLLKVNNLVSIPYIEMTLEAIHNFGGRIYHQDYQYFYIPGKQNYSATDYKIEGDWSSAAFLLSAAALSGEIELSDISTKSLQADKAIIGVLKMIGADITENTSSVKCFSNELNAFTFDATNCPDLFPVLIALAIHCSGTSVIKGIHRLIYKESNRALVLQQEFSKFGALIEIIDNEMHIIPSVFKKAEIDANNDHRIAMAAAVAAIKCPFETVILNTDCVAKSYPDFFEDFKKLGVSLHNSN